MRLDIRVGLSISHTEFTDELVTHSAFSEYRLRVTEPNLCDSDVKQYSGYLDITNGKHLFFWYPYSFRIKLHVADSKTRFFEARNSPETADFIYWANGTSYSSSRLACFTFAKVALDAQARLCVVINLDLRPVLIFCCRACYSSLARVVLLIMGRMLPTTHTLGTQTPIFFSWISLSRSVIRMPTTVPRLTEAMQLVRMYTPSTSCSSPVSRNTRKRNSTWLQNLTEVTTHPTPLQSSTRRTRSLLWLLYLG